MKKILIPLGVVLSVLTAGCKKTEPPPVVQKCNLVEARSLVVNNFNPNHPVFPDPLPLFQKTYDPVSGKLSKLNAYMLYPGTPFPTTEMQVVYNGSSQYFLKSPTDTIAVFTYDNAGKIVEAFASGQVLSLRGFRLTKYRFNYTDGKLSSIDSRVERDNIPFNYPLAYRTDMRFFYDDNVHALKKIEYLTSNGTVYDTQTFEYDLTRKAKNQFYGDDFILSSSATFWQFLRYFDLFPEMRSEYLLAKVFETPGVFQEEKTKIYKNQVVDSNGNLISYSYDQYTFSAYRGQADWTVNWSCSNNASSKAQ